MKPHNVTATPVAGVAARPTAVSLNDDPYRPATPFAHVARALALALLSFLILAAGLRPADAASDIVVTYHGDTVADDGLCTLREAITAANTDTASGLQAGECAAGAGDDVITFAGDYVITLQDSQLPAVMTPITITGLGPTQTIIQASTCNPVTLPGGCTPADWRVFEVSGGGNLTLDQVTVRHGRLSGTDYGGGIYSEQGTLTITDSVISSNVAHLGGGINSYAGTLVVTNSLITGNSAYNGGGINNNEYGVATVNNSTIADNSASYGGGIINFHTLKVTNSTFDGNSGGMGGGILNYWSGGATVTNSTFAGNSATETGGIYNYEGTITLTNTLFQTGATGGNCDGFSADSSNIADDASCGAATQMTAAEINLGPLADNGGPTQTHALLPGSAAIDFNESTSCTGDPVNGFDQRGKARNLDGDGQTGDNECDTGAYEAQLGHLTIAKSTDPAGGADFLFTLDTGATSYDRQWGSEGDGSGEFMYPDHVAVDLDGNVYVTDYFNARVQKFNNAGNFLLTWGWGVLDHSNTFQICSSDCTQGQMGGGDGQFYYPTGIAIDAAGEVWVADHENSRVQHFSSDGAYLGQFPTGGKPYDLAFNGDGDLYVTDLTNSVVHKFSPAGALLDDLGSLGSAEGQFNLPMGVDIDAGGNVYVSDYSNHRIQKFTAAGDFELMWGWGVDDGSAAWQTCTAGCQAGLAGDGVGQLKHPQTVHIAGDKVYVADTENDRIQVFDAGGAYLTQLGRLGIGDGEFNDPIGLATDTAGNLFVVDKRNYRVQVFTPDRRPFTLDDGQSEPFTLPGGQYRIDESAPIGWTLDNIVCDGGNPIYDATGATVTLDAGAIITCTFTNAQPPATAALTIFKEVSGGPETWSFDFSGDLGGFTLLHRHKFVTFRDLPPDTYTFSETAVAGYTATIACDNGAGSATGSITLTLAAGDDVTCTVTNTYTPPVFVSATAAGRTDDGLAFGPHDVLKWDGEAWTKAFDGSDAGLSPSAKWKHNINAFWFNGEDAWVIGFAQNARVVPGIGPAKVDGMDLVAWDGSSFALYFDGNDVGLDQKTQEKIDGLHVLPGDAAPDELEAAVGGSCRSYLLISTQGPGKVTNHDRTLLKFSGEDVLGFCMVNSGSSTTGLWTMVLDGSAQGMPKNSTDSISVTVKPNGYSLYLTTRGGFHVGDTHGGHSVVYVYDSETQTFSGPLFSAPAAGLNGKVDGLQYDVAP